jgi:hypothetical protein
LQAAALAVVPTNEWVSASWVADKIGAQPAGAGSSLKALWVIGLIESYYPVEKRTSERKRLYRKKSRNQKPRRKKKANNEH